MRGIYYLEAPEEEDTSETTDDQPDEMTVSMHALSGVRMAATLSLATTVADGQLSALVDSGSTHCFIAADTARQLGLVPAARPGLTVSVANDDRVPMVGVCKAVPITIHGEAFAVDLYAIDLHGYDLVLGCDWLSTLGPTLWDFKHQSMAFWRDDHRVHWQGISSAAAPHLAVTSAPDLLQLLLAEFAVLFLEPTGLPPTRSFDHRIHLHPGTPPVAMRPYRYPQRLKDEIENQCAAMRAQGIMRASTSAFSSPVLLVRKPDDSWRFCVDYRALNSKTVRGRFPIPIVDELLDELKGVVFFTKLDLRSGYHQVRMHPDDVHKTAFRTHHGHFEFLVMPFGLTNTSSTFQALMNEVLRPFLRRFVLVFFDDILIYSRTYAKHLQHIRAVLSALRAHGLVLKRSSASSRNGRSTTSDT
jgi:hypothetical protein